MENGLPNNILASSSSKTQTNPQSKKKGQHPTPRNVHMSEIQMLCVTPNRNVIVNMWKTYNFSSNKQVNQSVSKQENIVGAFPVHSQYNTPAAAPTDRHTDRPTNRLNKLKKKKHLKLDI